MLSLAQKANWSAGILAKECGVSLRTLERHFLKEMAKRPQAWLAEQRQKQARAFLQAGISVKETANHIGYQNASTFSREFKKHHGTYPTTQAEPKKARNSQMSEKDM